jgi:hypothetical protein
VSNQVYANNMEVSCKAAAGKSICAFPDVCMTPPQTPATPPGVPVPYPNTGMASDTTDGSTSVKVSGQEVMLKNKSCFKRSTGDEAGCAPMKGVMTHKNMGKVYFTAWSMDVKVEGENVVRMLDMTTHNHGSNPPNTGPWPYLDEAAVPGIGKKCETDKKKQEEACKDCKPKGSKPRCPPHKPPKPPDPADTSISGRAAALMKKVKAIAVKRRTKAQKEAFSAANKAYKATPEYKAYQRKHKKHFEDLAKKTASDEYKCAQASRCMLVPYKSRDKDQKCCPGQTPHHLIEASAFLEPGTRGKGDKLRNEFKGSDYKVDKAPCICAEGQNNTAASHGLMHTYQGVRARKKAPSGRWSMKEATECAGASVKMVFPTSDCDQACIEAQVKAYHEQEDVGIGSNQEIPASPSGRTKSEAAEKAWEQYDQAKAAGTRAARRSRGR